MGTLISARAEDGFERLGPVLHARVEPRVRQQTTGLPRLQVLDARTIVPEMQDTGQELVMPGGIPVPLDRDGFGCGVDGAVASAADLQGLPEQLGSGIGEVVRVLDEPDMIAEAGEHRHPVSARKTLSLLARIIRPRRCFSCP